MIKCDAEGCDAEYENSLEACPECGKKHETTPVDESKVEEETQEKIAIEETNYLADLAGIHYTPAPTIEETVKTEETPVVEEVETPTDVKSEVVTESNDGLMEEPATADETAELEWLKSLASN